MDLRAGELRKAGVKVRLPGQRFEVLTILLEHAGEVVTREELQQRLWPDTFVDVEHNLNTAINKIREVLGDSSESPLFIQTLPRRGYRFIASLEKESQPRTSVALEFGRRGVSHGALVRALGFRPYFLLAPFVVMVAVGMPGGCGEEPNLPLRQ